jgi:hypothetical protein
MARFYATRPRSSKVWRALALLVGTPLTFGLYPLVDAEARLLGHRRRNAGEGSVGTKATLTGPLLRVLGVSLPIIGLTFLASGMSMAVDFTFNALPILLALALNFYRAAVRRHELEHFARPDGLGGVAAERVFAMGSSWEKRANVDFALLVAVLLFELTFAFLLPVLSFVLAWRFRGALDLHERHEEELARSVAPARETARTPVKV